jgi:hypothetical protein
MVKCFFAPHTFWYVVVKIGYYPVTTLFISSAIMNTLIPPLEKGVKKINLTTGEA